MSISHPPSKCPTESLANENQSARLQWTQRTPILGNNLIGKQFAAFLMATFLFTQVIFAIVGYFATGELFMIPWQGLAIAWGIVLLLLMVAVFAVYRNRYSLQFTLDDWGVRYTSGVYEKKVNRFVMAAGAMSGSARTTGSALTAAANESGEAEWGKFSRARINLRTRRIVLYRYRFPIMELFCPEDLFPQIRELVKRKVSETHETGIESAGLDT